MKKLAISLFIGILFIGFGAGVTAIEVMSFTFGGEKFLPISSPNIVSEKRYETIRNTDGKIMIHANSDGIASVAVVSDDTLPPEQIRFNYTIDKNNYYFNINNNYYDDSSRSDEFYLYTNYSVPLPFDSFKEILEDSKHKIFYKYKNPPANIDVVIYVSPENVSKILVNK